MGTKLTLICRMSDGNSKNKKHPCKESETLKVQNKFQTCSHSMTSQFYETSLDLTNPRIIGQKMCDALITIETKCVPMLRQCFARDDVEQMKRSHMDEMKLFLVRIVKDKVGPIVIDNCSIVEVATEIYKHVSDLKEQFMMTNEYVIHTTTASEDQSAELNTDKPGSLMKSDTMTVTKAFSTAHSDFQVNYANSVIDIARQEDNINQSHFESLKTGNITEENLTATTEIHSESYKPYKAKYVVGKKQSVNSDGVKTDNASEDSIEIERVIKDKV